jgi:hypothetical protein
MTVAETPSVTKPRRRQVRPEVVAITIERLEHLTLTANTTDGLPSLVIGGLEDRLSALEDAKVPAATLRNHNTRLEQLEAAMNGNGYDRGAA